MTILNRFVGEVLADVNVLGPFSTADDFVASYDASVVVFVYGSRGMLSKSHALEQIPIILDFGRCCGCGIELCLCSGEGRCLLHLRVPHDRSLVV